MSIMIDCTQSPSVAALQAADAPVVARYLSWVQGNTAFKRLTDAELAALHLGGEAVFPNWEYNARDWLGGASAGNAHATAAVNLALALGFPAGTGIAIAGSADFDMQLSEWQQVGKPYVDEYARVCRGEGFGAGPYGPYDVLTWCYDNGTADVLWQSMSTAHSGGRNATQHPHADFWQKGHKTVGGLDTDWNLILSSRAMSLAYAGVANPVPVPKPAFERLLVDGIWGYHTNLRLQQFFGTPQDGVMSLGKGNSSLAAAMQRKLNELGCRDERGLTLVVDADGYSFLPQDGHHTHSIAALERRMGRGVDGYLSYPSPTVEEMQRRLNSNTF